MSTWSDLQIEVPASGGAERFTTCPKCSASRRKKTAKCLSVNVDKEVWHCAHCGWKGSLRQGEQARPQVDRWKPPVYARPTYTFTSPSEQLAGFFLARGIGREVLERYLITLAIEWMPSVEDRVPVIQFPYLRNGEVVNVKSRTLMGKEFRQVADAEKVLYGLDDIKDQVEIVIVEGECDKLAFAQAGIYHVVSVPDGAPALNAKPSAKKFEYLENCEWYFEGVTKIIMAVDADAPGVALGLELMRRLGPERCWTVSFPAGVKDANALLVAEGVEAMHALLAAAIPNPIEHVVNSTQLTDQVMQYYYHGAQRGLSTGWPMLDQLFTVSPAQFTSVTGIPSHGKSEFMDALMINMIALHGAVFAVCSPENRPTEHHLAKLAEKIIGLPFLDGPTERMSADQVTHALDWLAYHLFIIDSPEPLSVDGAMKKAKALVLQKGVTHLILDPWNEFDHARPPSQTETDYVSVAISQMKSFARRHGVHVFVIAHPTKLQRDKDGNYPIPTPYDISGSAHWRNKPDNCITVWRDTQKDEQGHNTYYSEVHVTKVRWKQNGAIGKMALRWNPLNGIYTETALENHTNRTT